MRPVSQTAPLLAGHTEKLSLGTKDYEPGRPLTARTTSFRPQSSE